MAYRFNSSAIICGIIACLIGLAYLYVADAPINMLIVNAAALAIGLLSALAIRRFVRFNVDITTILACVGSVLLLVTATFGHSIQGASRWVLLGPFFIQTSLILLPVVALSFARVQNLWTVLAVVIAALAMAIQPDRAMAGMLGLAALIICYRRTNALTAIAAASCAVAFAVTLFLPDRLPAVPYVDHILWTGFDISFAVGLLLWIGCLAMICPVFLVPKEERTVSHYTFASCWFALIAAAAMGAYPTPLVGYGSSAIVGYFLSLVLVVQKAQAQQVERRSGKSVGYVDADDLKLRLCAG